MAVENLETIADEEEDLFHVINYQDGNGWAIISADKRTIPVLAYSEDGTFETKNVLGGVEQWIDFAKKEIRLAKKQNKPEPEIEAMWKRMEMKDKEKEDSKNGRVNGTSDYSATCNSYLTPCPAAYTRQSARMTHDLSRWGQGAGYNFFMLPRDCGDCDRMNTGCGPVAIAQIMRYYRKGFGLNYTDDFMPMWVSNVCDGLSNGERQVATLMFRIFANTNTYPMLNCNTFTDPFSIKDAFAAAGYSNPGKLYDFRSNLQKINNSLLSGNPMIIMGTTCSTCFSPSHIWVLDGYRRNTYFDLDCSNNYPYCREYSYTYYHLNWGWRGGSNGWYGINNFRTRDNGNVLYNDWLRVHMDIRP